MTTCESCRHWKRFTKRQVQMTTVDWRDEWQTIVQWGFCRKFHGDRRAIEWLDYGHGHHLETHQDFGCNQHKAKP
jgi:hypothetical protein